MKEYKRQYPLFSLCGLNCGLCPRFNTEGPSKCPGCGGEDFHLKHPSCSVITCSKSHDNVEYCFQCTSFPCEKYMEESSKDSFITYKNVLLDFRKAESAGLEKYEEILNEKIEILQYLIENFNDGRRKSFYCTSVNLLEIEDLREIINSLQKLDFNDEQKIKKAVLFIESKAKERKIQLNLRK
nr:DUF3795 domain-containing protein [Sedimentibacter sp.]